MDDSCPIATPTKWSVSGLLAAFVRSSVTPAPLYMVGYNDIGSFPLSCLSHIDDPPLHRFYGRIEARIKYSKNSI